MLLGKQTGKTPDARRDCCAVTFAAKGDPDNGFVAAIKVISGGGRYRYLRINPGALDKASTGEVVWSCQENMPAVRMQ